MLSLTGAGLRLVMAYTLVAVIVANLPEFSFPHEAAIQINVPVLLFCIAAAVGTGILFGLSPAWQLSRPEVSSIMQSNTRKMTTGVRGRNVHRIGCCIRSGCSSCLLDSSPSSRCSQPNDRDSLRVTRHLIDESNRLIEARCADKPAGLSSVVA